MPNRQGQSNEPPPTLPSTLPDPSLDLDDIDEGSPRRDGGGAPQSASPPAGRSAPLREGEKVAEWNDDAQDEEPPGFSPDGSDEPDER